MFYICKGCDDGCKGCSKACDNVCGGFAKCMGAVCAPLAQVCDRPLGSYVVMTWLFNIPAAGMAGASLANAGVKECTEAPLMMSNGANAALGLIHAGFAIYLQQRLVHLLRKAGGEGGDQNPSPKDLMKRAWDIILYDVGFCIYIFVFIGSFGFNCYSMSWPGRCNTGTSLPFFASMLLVMFAFAAGWFMIMWYFALACQDCCGGVFGQAPARVVLGRAYGHSSQARPFQAQAQVVGQPAGYAAKPPVAQVMQPSPAQAVYAGHPQPAQAVPAAQVVYATPVSAGQPAPSGGAGATSAVAGAAATAAGVGLGLAGQGLQQAGKWLGGRK